MKKSLKLGRKNKNNKKGGKTRKNVRLHKKNDVLDSVSNLNNLLLTVKLYHWTSDYFNIHKVTDKFLKTLSPLLDKYVEVYLGLMLNQNNLVERKLKNKLRKVNIKPITNKNELIKQLNKNINVLKNNNHSIELDAVRDEIVSELQKFKYLLNFK
jgi:DNA-binding ferritin-like protein